MHPFVEIKKEHTILKKKLEEIEKVFNNKNRDRIRSLLQDFGSFWAQHEEKEEKLLDWFELQGNSFPFHKMIITQHKELIGHWKVIQKFLDKKSDLDLHIALDTDGKMILEKFKKHMEIEERYFDKYLSQNINQA